MLVLKEKILYFGRIFYKCNIGISKLVAAFSVNPLYCHSRIAKLLAELFLTSEFRNSDFFFFSPELPRGM